MTSTTLLPVGTSDSEARDARLRVAAAQVGWQADAIAHRRAIRTAVAHAAGAGADLVFLPELTLSPYRASAGDPIYAELVQGGPTYGLAAWLAHEYDVHVHASLVESAGGSHRPNHPTAIVVGPSGALVARSLPDRCEATLAGTADDLDPRSRTTWEMGRVRLGLSVWDRGIGGAGCGRSRDRIDVAAVGDITGANGNENGPRHCVSAGQGPFSCWWAILGLNQ